MIKLITLICSLVLMCRHSLAEETNDIFLEEVAKRIYKTLDFEVPIDHFSFASNQTFKIRYLYNDTYWDEQNGPIFFYTGNEVSNVCYLFSFLSMRYCILYWFSKNVFMLSNSNKFVIEFKLQIRKKWIALLFKTMHWL